MREITGKERNTMNKRKRNFSIRLATAAVCTAAIMVSGAQAAFADVPNSAYYKSAVDWAVSKGVTAGKDTNHFDPSGICTRAQTVTFMWRAAGSPTASGTNPFTDVQSTDYYYNAVLWAVQNNITSGISATQFAPNKPISRAQVACFLYKQAGSPMVPGYDKFSDVPYGRYYTEAVRWAEQKDITTGTSKELFSPDKSCTRAQIVTFLKRYEERPSDGKVLAGTELDNLKATIINGFENVEKEIDLSAFRVDRKQLQEILDSIYDKKADNNKYYIGNAYITYAKDYTPSGVSVWYKYSDEEVRKKREADTNYNNIIQSIVKDNVKSGMSDFEKAKALHDYLILNCAYDYDNYLNNTIPDESYSGYGALVKHTAVCSGYASAYASLLKAAGIPAYWVSGKVTSGGHAWNIIQIDGEWYHVDTTWDDPVPDVKGRLCYTYFLRSDKYMRSHEHTSWDSNIKCTSTKYDSYDPIAEAQEEQRRKEEEERRKQQEEQQRQEELKQQEEQKQQEEAKKQEELKKQQEAEQKQQEQNKQEQEREQTIRNIQAEIKKQLDARAYPDAESLKNAADISYDDVNFYVYLPDDYELHQLVLEACRTFDMSAYEPAITWNGTESPNQTADKLWHVKFWRHDIWDELKRREGDQQAETDRQVESVIQELQQAIIDGTEHGNRAKFTYDCSGYSYEVILAACKKMQAKDYSFSIYTSSDYSLSQRGTTVEIYSKRWEDNEIARWIPIFEEGVRNHETRITVPIPDEYFESGSTPNYIVWASWEVFREGYTVDNMTAGTDYTKTDSHFNYNPQSNKTESYCVTVSYADSQAVSVDE